MEVSLGQSPHWIEPSAKLTWADLDARTPDIFFCGGYATPAFNGLARETRSAGGRVILMSDNNRRSDLRRGMLLAAYHRLFLRSQYDAVFVPGVSGARNARRWGYSKERTATGLLGADPRVFNCGLSVVTRPKTFLFVGELIQLKNILGLAEAFIGFSEDHPDWSLWVCGAGPNGDDIPVHPKIEVRGFVQPAVLADTLRGVRCLVLPSFEEHWGLVVHEAALAGCALALSSAVGAAEDLANEDNSVLFAADDPKGIARGLSEIAGWDDTRWLIAERTSRERAMAFGPEPFADSVDALIARVC